LEKSLNADIDSSIKKTTLEPFVGPRPFERNMEDQLRFFGRQKETQEILSLILNHSLVIIYGQSGCGKTSIFNAQIIPLLEAYGFQILPMARVGISSIMDNENEDINTSENTGIFNAYMFNAYKSFFSGHDIHSFTYKRINKFLNEHSSLDEIEFKEKITPQIMLFDQFEELFTYYPSDNWLKQREDFFIQIEESLEKRPELCVIFIMREEYLAQLDPFAWIFAEKMRSRFRLDHLNKKDARLAIKGPLKEVNAEIFEKQIKEIEFDNEIEKLIDNMSRICTEDPLNDKTIEFRGELVDAIYLQSICQIWWKNQFPLTIIKNFVSKTAILKVDDVLKQFYNDIITSTCKETRISEDKIRKWCENNLITSTDKRKIVQHNNEFINEIQTNVIDIFERKGLVKAVFLFGVKWYELTHDRLISPIRASNKTWRQQHSVKFKMISIIKLLRIKNYE
jgi:hypothetical protein